MPRASGLAGAVLCATLLAGCALLATTPAAPQFAGQPGLTVAEAAQRITPGQSTRAQVTARLGAAETLRFDSGWEVWVYRARASRPPNAAPELLVLFGPDGVARKVRSRGADAPIR